MPHLMLWIAPAALAWRSSSGVCREATMGATPPACSTYETLRLS